LSSACFHVYPMKPAFSNSLTIFFHTSSFLIVGLANLDEFCCHWSIKKSVASLDLVPLFVIWLESVTCGSESDVVRIEEIDDSDVDTGITPSNMRLFAVAWHAHTEPSITKQDIVADPFISSNIFKNIYIYLKHKIVLFFIQILWIKFLNSYFN